MGKSLEPLGLSSTANQIYLTALEAPGQTASDLAELLGLDPGIVVRDCKKLINLGLATADGTAIVVLPPEAAAELLVLRQEGKLAAHESRLRKFRKHADLLTATPTHTGKGEVEIVTGEAAVTERLETLVNEAKSEIVTFAPGGAHTPDQIAEAQNRDAQMYARGVKARTIYLASIRKDHATMGHIEWLANQGAEVRALPKLPIRMLIVDRKLAILPLSLKDAMAGIGVYRNPAIVQALQELFELAWDSATPLGPVRRVGGNQELSTEEKDTLKLLAKGKNDSEISLKMGISESTIRRQVKNLQSRFNAKNRVQLIYQATKTNQI